MKQSTSFALFLAAAVGAFTPLLDASTSGPRPIPTGSRLLRLADLDGDGRKDKLLVTPAGELLPAINRGGGRFEPLACRLPAASAREALVADLNADGFVDLYLVARGANCALLGDGTGMLRDASRELGLTDRGDGLSAERMDLDGDAGLELVLHNADGDVIFWERGGVFERDAESPERPVAVASESAALEAQGNNAAATSSSSASSSSGGRSSSVASGGAGSIGGPTGGTAGSGVTTAPSAGTGAGPTHASSLLDDKYVNDDMEEVDSADIADGSLVGADVSTADGDVFHTGGGKLGVGTSSPDSQVHVVGYVEIEIGQPIAPGKGEVVVCGNPVGFFPNGPAEVRLASDPSGEEGMSFYYDGVSMELRRTDDGGETYDDPHLYVDESSGFIGMGQDAPRSELHVTGRDDRCELTLNPTDTNSDSSIYFAEGPNTNYGMKIKYDGGSNDLQIWPVVDGSVFLTPIVSIDRDDYEMDVNGELECNKLRIVGGSDIVEPFATAEEIEPGTVVVIDAENEGQLVASTDPYDQCVAGIVSGAGGVHPGMSLQQDDVLEGDTLVALTGRVYVKASAEAGAIRPGDRLTTADLEGHAMRVADETRAAGSVIGKAMSSLDDGTGLVLVLVNLQ